MGSCFTKKKLKNFKKIFNSGHILINYVEPQLSTIKNRVKVCGVALALGMAAVAVTAAAESGAAARERCKMGRLPSQWGGHCFLLQLLRSTTGSSDVGAPANSTEGCRAVTKKPLLTPQGVGRPFPGSRNTTKQYETCS